MHKYDTIGSVVHKVVEEVDAGEIATLSEVSSANLLSLDDVYEALRSTSLGSWCSFLKEHLYNKV
jgi:folate-dependent phosphoribosylglycinamide formyltransferase PurN